jgi:hypothetical protein
MCDGAAAEGETTMTANHVRETATIYQFPVGGRAGLARRREAFEQTTPQSTQVVVSGNWYHEEAIREAELSRKN